MLPSLRNSDPSEHISAPSKSDGDNVLSSSPHTLEDSCCPEGGMVAWCTVFGVFLAQFCGFGYTNAFGVYQAFYAQHYLQNSSPSAISWIGSLATFLVTAVGPICGPLFDNGYFYHVYITGVVLQSFSLFMLSLVQPGQYYQVLLAQGLVSGIGQGLMYVPSFAILSHHFKRRRATMMSIASSGVSLGGIANTIMLNQLLNGPIGFRMGVQISATFITVLLIISCLLMRTRYSAVRQDEVSVNSWKATKKCFTEVPSLLSITGFMLFQAAYTYPLFYFQVDSLRHGLSVSFAFYSLVVINAGSFVGRSVTGAILSYVGVVDLSIITIAACAILIIGMIWLGSVASVIVLGILYGLFSGINIAIMAPVLGLMSDPAELGVRLGVGFAITGMLLIFATLDGSPNMSFGSLDSTTGIGGLVGSPICGALLTNRYLWWAPALFCGLIALAGGVSFVGMRASLARANAGAAHTCAGDEQQIETGSRDKKKGGEVNA